MDTDSTPMNGNGQQKPMQPLALTDDIAIETRNGETFRVPLLDTVIAIRAIDKANTDGEAAIRAIQQMVADQTGLTLTLGESENLRDQLELEYAKKKRRRAEEMNCAVAWPKPTASTPLD